MSVQSSKPMRERVEDGGIHAYGPCYDQTCPAAIHTHYHTAEARRDWHGYSSPIAALAADVDAAHAEALADLRCPCPDNDDFRRVPYGWSHVTA